MKCCKGAEPYTAGWSLRETEGYSIAYLDKEVVNYYSFYLGVCRGAWRCGYWRKPRLY